MESTRREADPGRESFDEYLAQQSIQVRRWSLICACGLYLVFTSIDLIRFPDEVLIVSLPARIVLVWLPLLIGTWVFWTKRKDDYRHHLPLLTHIFIAAGLVNCLIRVVAWQHGIEFGQLGMMLILTFGCLLLGLPLQIALLGTLLLLCAVSISLAMTEAPLGEAGMYVLILSLHALVCLMINHICRKILQSNHRLISCLRHDANRDELTGLFNKRYFNGQFELLMERARERSLPVGLLMIDIDNFKQINDSIGHLAADQVLKKMDRLLNRQLIREEDFVARFGGDEFVIYLHNCDPEDVEQTCLALLGTVREHLVIFSKKGYHTQISLSIGASHTQSAQSEHTVSLLQAADEALYEAKHAGRNRYKVAHMEAESSQQEQTKTVAEVDTRSTG